MRLILLGVCVFAAACSGQVLDSPTSPTSGVSAPAQTPAKAGAQLPFRGSYTDDSLGVVTPPNNLRVDGKAEGNATHLGLYTATYTAFVVLGAPHGDGHLRLHRSQW
jgi:hypothetical protein